MTVAKVGVRKNERKCIVKLSVKVRLEKQMVAKLEQKWKPKDNVCLLSALWGMMSYEQIMLVTLGGKYQFMHFVQDAFGLVRGDHFRNGLASNDIIPQSANSKHTLSLGFHFYSNFTTVCFSKRTFTLSFTMHFLFDAFPIGSAMSFCSEMVPSLTFCNII